METSKTSIPRYLRLFISRSREKRETSFAFFRSFSPVFISDTAFSLTSNKLPFLLRLHVSFLLVSHQQLLCSSFRIANTILVTTHGDQPVRADALCAEISEKPKMLLCSTILRRGVLQQIPLETRGPRRAQPLRAENRRGKISFATRAFQEFWPSGFCFVELLNRSNICPWWSRDTSSQLLEAGGWSGTTRRYNTSDT